MCEIIPLVFLVVSDACRAVLYFSVALDVNGLRSSNHVITHLSSCLCDVFSHPLTCSSSHYLHRGTTMSVYISTFVSILTQSIQTAFEDSAPLHAIEVQATSCEMLHSK